jgi:hypothetical protein
MTEPKRQGLFRGAPLVSSPGGPTPVLGAAVWAGNGLRAEESPVREESRASFPTSGHALLSLLNADRPGLAAVLTALGSSPELLRLAVTEQLGCVP